MRGNYDTGFIERNKEQLLGWPEVKEDDAEVWAAAIAVAASRLEGGGATIGAGDQNGTSGPGGPSPWIATHRARRWG